MVDIIMRIDRLPKSGEDVNSGEQTITVGGCAYNVANILRSFKVDHDLVVPVGNGMYGQIIKKQLEVDRYPVIIEDDDNDNGYCLCLVEADGERTFITLQGIECDFESEWLDSIKLNQYDNIYISGYEVEGNSGHVISDWLDTNKDDSITLFFAPGPRITYIDGEVMDKLFKLSPVVHLNEKEILDYTNSSCVENALVELYKLTNNTVIVTMGDRGVIYYDGNEFRTVSGKKATVVDTIGAGDSHVAAMIAAKSLGYDIDKACKIANKVAADVVSIEGPTIKHNFNEEEYLS